MNIRFVFIASPPGLRSNQKDVKCGEIGMLKRGIIGMVVLVGLLFGMSAAAAQQPTDCGAELADVYLASWKAANGAAIGDLQPMDAAHVVTQVYKAFRRLGSDVGCAEIPLELTRTLLTVIESGYSGDDAAEIYRMISDNVSVLTIAEAPCAYLLTDTFLRRVDWNGVEVAQIGLTAEKAFGVAQQVSGSETCAEQPALLLTQAALNHADALAADPLLIRSVYQAIADELGSADA
jgi:hypothetical protein